MATKVKDKLGVEKIEVLADKEYYNLEDIIKCENDGITTYVSKTRNSNFIGDSRYFIDKFKYIKDLDIYICPEGNCLEFMTIKKDTIAKRYRNLDACANCKNKKKCTTAKATKIVLWDQMNQWQNNSVNDLKMVCQSIKRDKILWNTLLGL